MFYTVYKVTNNINNKIYIGVHKTTNIDDGYMGSGKLIKSAINKYGIENFSKEILKIFDNEADMFRMEAELVNEHFVSESTNYNIRIGGDGGWSHLKDNLLVKDKDGNVFSVKRDDPRYLNGELVHNTTGLLTVKDKDGNTFSVKRDDPRYLNGELVHNTTGRVTVKDKDGNTFSVETNDPRYLSGELVHNWCNKKHTEETKKLIGLATSKHQRGKGNSQYGTVWIYSLTEQINRKIKREELEEYIDAGWVRGRRNQFD